MTLSCGRVRKRILPGFTPILTDQLKTLQIATLNLTGGMEYALATEGREYAIVLVRGECSFRLSGGPAGSLGPRPSPFDDQPWGLFISRDEAVHISTRTSALLALGSAPAARRLPNSVITPANADSMVRGAGNWEREVRKVCWSNNTEGNMLLAGETVTQSGNWCTFPPHRHQYHIDAQEVPYEEAYLFQFSTPAGFGLSWQFDDDGELDQAFSLKTDDVLYGDGGYHPVVCSPGTNLYHVTFMSGPFRMSQASLHPAYAHVLEGQGIGNQYRP